ncbi:conserved hypothetical protein [Nitrosomonas nitrosa]|uniref:DUF4145 domain-containing protein n=1 Tax=Nitrosomonas nitrosa TaxID=52442 RepID=A0A8H8Z112_9PROT|nr:hypothetical protein [Nitrosomonas nitrosa]CAE6506846.1 conserved hypothetical protein [Nitrosomonas nitrosa]
MDWMTFIVEMVKALAWPVAVALAVFYFKGEVAKLIPRLKKLKHKDTEFEFAERIEELAKDLAASGEKLQPPEPGENLSTDYNVLMRLSNISPRSAIMEAFRTVETAAARALSKAYPELKEKGAIPPIQLLKLLRGKVLDEHSYRQLNELRMLRNKAAHDEEFFLHGMPIEAYVDIALTMARLLDRYEP